MDHGVHEDQLPSTGADITGHSVAFCTQCRVNVSPFGAVVQASNNSFQPQYGSMAFRQLGFDTCRWQLCAGSRSTASSVPMYKESAFFKYCIVRIRIAGWSEPTAGRQTSTTQLDLVLGRTEIFFIAPDSVATNSIVTLSCNFVEITSRAM